MKKPATSRAAARRSPAPASVRSGAHLPIRRILVPIDFSDFGKPALAHARHLATIENAHLILVHVMDLVYPEEQLSCFEFDAAKLRAWAEGRMQAIAQRDFAGLRTEIHLREGHPFEEIVNTARKAKADLIIMATHGATGLDRILMGSTAERVVRHAECPVLVVRSRLKKTKS
ncbi:MAG TPA: universal stress protein [Terrimicrobiaceae bacterium]|nr:universal stress protein [Terrimicrobiaceae bacterium]